MPYGERDVRYSEFQAPIIRYGGGLVGTHILSLHAHLLNLRDVSLNSLHELQLTFCNYVCQLPDHRAAVLSMATHITRSILTSHCLSLNHRYVDHIIRVR